MESVAVAPLDLPAGHAPSSQVERVLAVLVVTVPALGTIAAFTLPIAHQAPLRDALIFALMYLVTGFGITVGFHRLFTHRSFEASPALRVALAIAGSMALQGPVIRWVSDHRRHHAHSDEPGDPHSPVVGGFFHAHVGWLWSDLRSRPTKYAKDLLGDKTIRALDRRYLWWMAASLAVPTLLGGLVGGSLEAAVSALLWGGFARLFFVHHVTWAINSVCHVVGRSPYASRDQSRNVAWLALPSLGESWHNNHHAFPTSSAHGLGWYQLDPSAWLIRAFVALGLASAPKRPTDKALHEKLRGAAEIV